MISLTKKVGLGLAAAAAIGASVVAMSTGNPASADPKQYTDPLFGFGSDTLQDVTNAFSGYSNDVFFTPLETDNGKVMASWDAFPAGAANPSDPDCIVPQVGTGQILRPNGSGNGHRALSATVGGTNWPASGTDCGGPRGMAGIVDFSRSSGGPGSRANASGPIQFIPAFKDALSFAYVKPSGGTVVTDLSPAELTRLHANGPEVIDGVPIIACGIQTGSGTYGTWVSNLGIAEGADTGTNLCNNAGLNGRLQENNSPQLLEKGTLLSSISSSVCGGPCTNAQLIVGYSASQFIARGNGVGVPDSDLSSQNGGLGSIDGRQAVSGTAPNLVPVAAAYNDPTFGRTVYYLVDFLAVEYSNAGTPASPGIPDGEETSPGIIDMFVSVPGGDDAEFCKAGTTIEQHGFLQVANCGDLLTSLRATFRS